MARKRPSLTKQVIQAFGGTTALSRALNIPVTTVDGWRAHNNIPRWRIRAIVEAAQAGDVDLPDGFGSAA